MRCGIENGKIKHQIRANAGAGVFFAATLREFTDLQQKERFV